MATTTTNFGWDIPQSTDLVKDGATAIAALGQDIDTAMVDLKGGTTGQVLSKASNTDLDFTWVTDAAGDITGVTAGTGISGGGTSGTVTVTNSMATAIDAKGDLIAGTGADAFSRLAVGADGTALVADSSAATGLKWASASSGLTFISAQSFSAASSVSVNTVFSSTYTNYRVGLLITSASGSDQGLAMRLRASGTDTTTGYASQRVASYRSTVFGEVDPAGTDEWLLGSVGNVVTGTAVSYDLFNVNNTSVKMCTGQSISFSAYTNEPFLNTFGGRNSASTQFDGFSFYPASGTITGTVFVYGYQKA
jgi:hypothetical protein